ncbi:MAG: hydroxyacylglutathione hydrolase [Proteobacteria bacterium]|nr:hydroxyacylglutathione hydrolase [Pseudomonadota bacterium]
MKDIIVDIVPYYDDNYSYLIRSDRSGKTALVDCGDSGPVLDRLEKNGWKLDLVCATHHHYDHAGDIPELLKHFPQATVVKPAGESRISVNALEVRDGDFVPFGEYQIEVVAVPAHTKYCTSYFLEGNLFVGDALFSAGCGRLFEGDASDLEKAMDRLSSFPNQTNIYVGHEYTLTNLRFAASIEPDNLDIESYLREVREKLDRGEYSTPTSVEFEKKVNPFLRIDQESVIRSIDSDRQLDRTRRIGVLRSKKDAF